MTSLFILSFYPPSCFAFRTQYQPGFNYSGYRLTLHFQAFTAVVFGIL